MKINWKSKTFLTATVMIIVYIGCLATSVLASTGWLNTLVGSKGTITITAQNYSYGVNGTFDFGTHQYLGGGNFVITSTPITVTNTGNQEIKGWSISSSVATSLLQTWIDASKWITVSISQTDIPVGGTGQVTATLTATNIPNTDDVINFVGTTALNSISFNIIPASTPQ